LRCDPTVAIGTVFELAVLLGVPLFVDDRSELSAIRRLAENRLELLPRSVRPGTNVDDDF